MADMALGLTKRAVEGTVTRVLAAIDEDTKLKAAAQQDLRFIVGEFQMMQSFLEMANDNKVRTSNKVVKTWVRQLRELAFDVEDCVEFVIHLDTTSARARKSWVWRVMWLPSCLTPAWVGDLDQAVAQLKQLKARVEEVSQRNTRYNLLGGDDSGSSTTTPQVLPEKLEAGTAFPSTVDILRDLWKANAKQSSSYKCNLQYLITDRRSNDLRVISVWRSTGVDVEAAHILNTAYCDPEICRQFKARARVELMHPFNIQEFLKSLLNQLYVTASQQQETLGADLSPAGSTSVVHDEIKQLLSKHKYLIILEGLSSAVEWELIRFYLPDHHNGNRIVISTEHLGFALWCTGEPYRVLQLALFPNDRYIYAFYKPSVCIKELVRQLGHRRVISLWGDEGGDTSSIVRDVYEAMKNKTTTFKGVNFEKFESFHYVPCGRLWGRRFCDLRWLIVIDGLQSKKDWERQKYELVPEGTRSCIVVIANEEAVAKHCEDDSWRKIDEEQQEEANNATIIGPLFAQKEKYYSWGHHGRFGSHGCSYRIEEAVFQFAPFMTPEQDEVQRMIRISEDGMRVVWGATGVGKSSLVRFAYHSLMVCSLNMVEEAELPKYGRMSRYCFNRYERFGWVDVPKPFDLVEFSRRLLLDFNSHDAVEMEKTTIGIIQGHNPIQQCYETIRNQKSLVVIDGLQSKHDWDFIEQAFWCQHHPKSSILVITTDESVAKHCIKNYIKNLNGYKQEFPIRALDDKSALELFTKIAEKQKNEWTTEQNLKHAKHIVPKCGGLPKIIDAVAKSPCSFFDDVNVDLVTKLKNGPQFDHVRGVLSWMHSYFDGCSDSVKPCLFYLSVFPTNYKIRKSHLLRRWVAEGYSRDTSGCSAKENAERLFTELVKLGIIQEVANMPLCQISGLFREYIISQPMEDNLVFALEGHCKPNSQRTGQHLTIMKSWEREQQNVFESIDVSRLRSLTVYGMWQSFFISDKMKRMRVLDLEGTSSGLEHDDLERIFGILLSLKFICLRGCKSITFLPETFGGLRQLESLDVRDTSIVALPQAIIKLQKIQYIRAGLFLPFEDWTSAASEDNSDDDAVASPPQPLAASEDDIYDAVASQQPARTTPTPEAEGSDGDIVMQFLPFEDWPSAASEDNSDDDAVASPPQPLAASKHDIYDAVASQQPARTTPTPEAEGSDGDIVATSPSQDKEVDVLMQKMPPKNYKVGCCWTSRLSSRLSPRLPRRYPFVSTARRLAHNNIINGGVEVPKGIEDMPALHTLGTVNIHSALGRDFLTKLKDKTKLPQLLKLSVCGINNENWKDLCDALFAHGHLESLSLGFDEDIREEDSCFNNPPKVLKSLRLHGHIHRSARARFNDHRLVVNKLEKFDLEVIISSQGDMDGLLSWLPLTVIRCRLCIKLTQQVRKLNFNDNNAYGNVRAINGQQVLKIDCSSQLKVAFQKYSILYAVVGVLVIHCSKESDFRISSNEGLKNLERLHTVWLKGYDENADYVAHLKEQVAAHPQKPAFKFEKLKSA